MREEGRSEKKRRDPRSNFAWDDESFDEGGVWRPTLPRDNDGKLSNLDSNRWCLPAGNFFFTTFASYKMNKLRNLFQLNNLSQQTTGNKSKLFKMRVFF